MVGHNFSFFTSSQIEMLRDKVLELLQTQGVKLDPHPQMFKALADAGANVDTGGGMVRFPKPVMERLLKQAPVWGFVRQDVVHPTDSLYIAHAFSSARFALRWTISG